MRVVGKSCKRTDAEGKVRGKARYTDDLPVKNMLQAKVLRSSIAHGYVKKIHAGQARALEGVVAVVTPDDVSGNKFSAEGHPFSLDPDHGETADKGILTRKVRFYGDEIAAVIAENALIAEKALQLISVEYEELPVYLTPEEATASGAIEIQEGTGNIAGQHSFSQGNMQIEDAFKECEHIFEGVYKVNTVQHCQLENHIAYAYTDEKGRITVVSSTQIPHICRRVVAQALGEPVGSIRIIKPYIGGGFGSKQDVCIEPLVAALSLVVGGRPVMLNLTREECMIATRVRHAIKFYLKTGVDKDGRMLARQLKAISNTGSYASHGHNVVAKAGGNFYRHYPAELATYFEGVTAYTNTPIAGAMRGYGIPQISFAMESHMDDVARNLGMDPIKFREKNMIREGFVDPTKAGAITHTCGLPECIEKAKAYIGWDEKRAAYDMEQTGDFRYGVGLACFSYGTGVWPTALEIGGARMVLNQDGSLQMQLGATEIGQGAETVFTQMAAESTGIPFDKIFLEQVNDTDVSPFDLGAYASRQSYVTGHAIKKAGENIRKHIMSRALVKFNRSSGELKIREGKIICEHSGEAICTVEQIALEAYYSREGAKIITSDVSVDVKSTTNAFGVSAAEIEVDIRTGRVRILKICNVHDSGTVLNPMLAEGQVHGGMSMSLGMGLSEVMLFAKDGKPLNNNLLDYKLPTMMDTPEMGVEFVETYEPTAPFGNKALGEPPAISPAPAVRNAVLQATGVGVNETPMNPQRLFERFSEEGLI